MRIMGEEEREDSREKERKRKRRVNVYCRELKSCFVEVLNFFVTKYYSICYITFV